MREPRHTTIAPSAARLTESLRDIGYDFPSAVADLVDNSVTAGATRVEIVIEYAGADSRIMIADDGCGMTANGVNEALRFGSRRPYGAGDLGRYGLGLKTASLSQARSLTVLSRGGKRVTTRQLSLDTIIEFDEWLVIEPAPNSVYDRAKEMLGEGTGTVVVWEKLDRIFQEQKPEGGWARRRVEKLAERASEHLALVFHRFLEGEVVPKVEIVVNGEKLRPWNPFAQDEPATKRLPRQQFELTVGDNTGTVTLDRYILPPRNAFSCQSEFERLSGPRKWNRQQGLYIYRADRLVQWGGWAGLRGIDEHLKLARVALDFSTDLDAAFNINVAKMRVGIPTQLRQMLERPIHEVCLRADDAYRRAAGPRTTDKVRVKAPTSVDGGVTLLALRAAAMAVGESAALRKILGELPNLSPDIATSLGLHAPASGEVDESVA
ncbi:ATP-binding protein [Geodermatophilus poikilotrophus]|uniref:Histidine kinase-, DNA gyrase B-, and HSP90-like ATPase n=1 Tax=Geodermatophilus poikilotrophus TaxID=1333667 RepID=A0A1I0CQ78_9ACTN|nr:ATP-binding protein [Geodermatophilus poikilotrophus]SET21914.1 Histidine kinase-, DNA gyrase B-, and HSP90-like ATPase [Geodermatophilus poikilotrophus]